MAHFAARLSTAAAAGGVAAHAIRLAKLMGDTASEEAQPICLCMDCSCKGETEIVFRDNYDFRACASLYTPCSKTKSTPRL